MLKRPKNINATLATLVFAAAFWPSHARSATPVLTFQPFGKIQIFRSGDSKGAAPLAKPKSLILLLSGDDGWSESLTEAARALATDATVVAGVDLRAYLKHLEQSKAKCTYPSGDLENLSKFVQAELQFTDYELPVLVGRRSAAGLAYGSFFQAPENTFMAAVGWDFCPSYKAKKQICPGDGMRSTPSKAGSFKIQSSKRALAGWTTIAPRSTPGATSSATSTATSRCPSSEAQAFTKELKVASFVPAVADGSVELIATVGELLKKSPAQNLHAGSVEHLTDLPLIILEPEKIKRGPGEFFALFYSGDGGWAGFDKDLSSELNQRGIPVVGLSTLSYFWKSKTPEECAADLKKIVENFQAKWGIKNVALLGYSFGADVLPFLVTRLPTETQKHIAQITLMSSSGFAEFEFHFGHWLSSDGSAGMPLIPALEKLKGKTRVQCLYGSEEKKPFCLKIDRKSFEVIELPGGHRFDGDQGKLADAIQSGFSKSP